MLEVMGWLFYGGILIYASLFVFFTTVSTFSEALFAKTIWHKLLGSVMWLVLGYFWYNHY